jgi:hypothetical protein
VFPEKHNTGSRLWKMHNNGDHLIPLNWPESLYQQVFDAVDWQQPALSTLAENREDTKAAVRALIRHLRARSTPAVGYTREYARRLRERADETQRRAARQRIEAALSGDLLFPSHRNAFSALGAETLLLGADAALCRRIAARVWECREHWLQGEWGVAGSVGEVVRFLWPLEECEDEVFVPLFGWLLALWQPEWEKARRWSETTLGTSSHNWWCHTLAGFHALGVCFPEFKGLAKFQALFPEFVKRALKLLFEDDGWSKEGSPGYHGLAVAALQEMTHLAAHNGEVVAPEIEARLRGTACASWRLLAPDGEFPAFGDHVPITLYPSFNGCGPGTLLRRQAARYILPEAKFVAEALDAAWQPPGGVLPDCGEDLLARYRELESWEPRTLDTALPRSGYYVMRQDWTPRADWVALDAGELGSRITSHKHVSLFNFELCARGRRLLVDNWYGPVSEKREDNLARMWRVGSSAHNVATVDGEDHVPIEGEYHYGGTVHPVVDDWRRASEYSYFSGVHEGYRHLPDKVSATRRKLFYLRGQYWILIDRFTPDNAARHEYTQHFHINAPAVMEENGRVTTRGAGGNLLIVPVCGATDKQTLEPCPFPVENYQNPHHLQYSGSATTTHFMVTLLIPFEDAQTPHVEARVLGVHADGRVLTPWEATALEITVNGRRDVYFDQHMEWNLPWRVAEYSGAGRLFHSRCETLQTTENQ